MNNWSEVHPERSGVFLQTLLISTGDFGAPRKNLKPFTQLLQRMPKEAWSVFGSLMVQQPTW